MKRDDPTRLEPLGGFTPRPAPPGLRSRVLSAARAVKPAAVFWSPAQWAAAAGCALSIVVLLAADARLARRLSGRMDVLLAEARGAVVAGEAVLPEMREAVGAELLDRIRRRPDGLIVTKIERRGALPRSSRRTTMSARKTLGRLALILVALATALFASARCWNIRRASRLEKFLWPSQSRRPACDPGRPRSRLPAAGQCLPALESRRRSLRD